MNDERNEARRAGRQIEDVLGPLGGAIARVVIEQGEATVADVVEALGRTRRPPAYTTVMTVMGRLYERGVLERRKLGRQYVYRPAAAEAALVDTMSERAVDEIIERYGEAALRQFAERLRGLDPDMRARLVELASRGQER
jgi:predicted transcriptional regulator